MAETRLKTELTLKSRVNHFIFAWNQFPIDYWWRKKYNVPFGSKKHREMNFIDMYIEFQEDVVMNKVINKMGNEEDESENEMLGLNNVDKNTISLSEEEIDKDFENLDLSQFDKK